MAVPGSAIPTAPKPPGSLSSSNSNRTIQRCRRGGRIASLICSRWAKWGPRRFTQPDGGCCNPACRDCTRAAPSDLGACAVARAKLSGGAGGGYIRGVGGLALSSQSACCHPVPLLVSHCYLSSGLCMMLTSMPLSPSSFLPASPRTPLAFSHAASDDLFDLLPSSLLTLAAFFRRYEPRLLQFLDWFKQAGFVLVRDLCNMTSEERRHLYNAVSGPSMPYSLQIRLERLIIADMGLSITGKNVATQTYPMDSLTQLSERNPPGQAFRAERPVILREQSTQWDPPAVDRRSSDSSTGAITLISPSNTSNTAREGSPRRDREHERANSFVCSQCDMKFARKSSLTVHYRIHTRYYPFHCDAETCSLSFRSKTTLDRHRQTHETQRTIICEVCRKEFKTSSALNKHRIIHDQVKAFQCPTCEKLFRRKDHLDVHLLTHSTQKNFSCDLCPKRFKQKSGLLVHRKSHESDLKCRYEQ